MTAPFLSIVTISFNQAQYARQAVESVLSQQGDDVEYIVVDPGSTDGSREILAGYGHAIDHFVFEPDNGPADGLNKGFGRATGRWIPPKL
ncbi:MAG: glycosyltransferase [Rhodospirillales bacterium]|nr:glycosyltransferase [Rhodospirillales bacterium]